MKCGFRSVVIALLAIAAPDGYSQVVYPPAALRMEVTKTGAGSGTVVSNPEGISCGSTCGAWFMNASYVTVELTAVASPGSVFVGWQGCQDTSTGTCRSQMGSYTAHVFQITARFELATPGAPTVV